MATLTRKSIGTALVLCLGLSACGEGDIFGPDSVLGRDTEVDPRVLSPRTNDDIQTNRESIFDLFDNRDDPNVTLAVNRYLWTASLEVLNFLPIETADPFSGVIVTGFGTPPGGRTAYRATVLVQDPALEARALTVSLQTRNGAASADTVRAVEDAILTRARQLRVRDEGF